MIANQYLTLRLMSLRSISLCVGDSNLPPGTTFQININDLFFRYLRYACVFQKHTKHTLFCVFVGLDFGLKHCVLTLVNEQSPLIVDQKGTREIIPSRIVPGVSIFLC